MSRWSEKKKTGGERSAMDNLATDAEEKQLGMQENIQGAKSEQEESDMFLIS